MYHQDNHTSLLASFIAFVREQNLIEAEETTLLAVSGGVDSVVMSNLFYQAKLPFALAHCNFKLREAASDQDEEFVRQLAQQYRVPCYTRAFNTLAYARENKLSIQMAARALRYQWFEELCTKYQLDKIATAHHGDDSLETLLLNLTKGTGIAGLHGILPRQGRVIRPLLFADKAMLLQYAQAHKLAWQEDVSNTQNYYARNLVRNKVVPLLKLINPNLAATSRLTRERLEQVEAFFHEYVAAIQRQIFHQHGEDYYVAIQTIQDKPWAAVVLAAMLKPFGFQFVQLQSLLAHSPQSGKMLKSAHYQLYVDRATWIITPCRQSSQTVYTIPGITTKRVVMQDYALHMKVIPWAQYAINPDSKVAALDLARLSFPLTIRRWQAGDAFYPLGMRQRKKVSDFLVDCKVPRPLKEHIYVMLTGHELAWVVGYRIDDRYKITNTTKMVYEARLIT